MPRSLQRPFLFTLQETCVLLFRSTGIFSGLEGQMKTIPVRYSWKGGGMCGAHISWLLVESSVGERKTNKGKLNLEEGEESKVAPLPQITEQSALLSTLTHHCLWYLHGLGSIPLFLLPSREQCTIADGKECLPTISSVLLWQ